jgi:hypothetical protein
VKFFVKVTNFSVLAHSNEIPDVVRVLPLHLSEVKDLQ